jgi:tetratricopeptide (TPR) repeat protein
MSTRNLAIGGGAIAVLIFAIVLASRGGHDKATAKHTTTAKLDSKNTAKTSEGVTGGNDVATTDGTGEQSGEQVAKSPTGTGVRTNNGQNGDEELAATGSDTTTTETPTDETPTETGTGTATGTATATTTSPAATPKTKTGRRPASGGTLGGKQVVLEYDNQTRDTKAAAPVHVGKSDETAITKARSAYASGNQRLFAGDPDGAIKFYRQALGYYPAYVAGYRGLGLAYAQQGNKAQAVKAFKTYVSSVPTAKDAALIRKRITALQAH